jgi:hypothetical protein
MEVCGHTATQGGEQGKFVISFSHRSGDRTFQHSGNDALYVNICWRIV